MISDLSVKDHGIVGNELRKKNNWCFEDFQKAGIVLKFYSGKNYSFEEDIRRQLELLQTNLLTKKGITIPDRLLQELFNSPQTFKLKNYPSMTKIEPSHLEMLGDFFSVLSVIISKTRESINPSIELAEKMIVENNRLLKKQERMFEQAQEALTELSFLVNFYKQNKNDEFEQLAEQQEKKVEQEIKSSKKEEEEEGEEDGVTSFE